MTEIEKEKKTYEDGVNDTWNIIKKIECNIIDGGLSTKELQDIFGSETGAYIVGKNTAQEAMAKIKRWEERKEIRIGDEIIVDGKKYVVLCISKDNKGVYHLGEDESIGFSIFEHCKKTGKNYSQVKELLNQMQEGK